MDKFAMIMGAMAAVQEILAWVGKQTEIARQSGELTPEQEAAIRQSQETTMATAPHWKKSTDS